ncbi:MAG: toxin, partial [bacterium]
VNIIWDEEKNDKLKAERGISFEVVADLIIGRKYVAILRNPKRPRQRMFLVPIHGYIHVVPFVFDEESNVVLKTVFPSRKLNKKYGEKKK